MNADGSGQQRLTTRGAQPGWSPDGRTIAFMSERDGNAEIYRMQADGTRQTRLTDHPAVDIRPAWSPDGRRLLVPWPDADQWLFLRPRGRGRLTAVANIAGQFMPGTTSPVFPRSVKWCCAGS